jgi:hypothetical protein
VTMTLMDYQRAGECAERIRLELARYPGAAPAAQLVIGASLEQWAALLAYVDEPPPDRIAPPGAVPVPGPPA